MGLTKEEFADWDKKIRFVLKHDEDSNAVMNASMMAQMLQNGTPEEVERAKYYVTKAMKITLEELAKNK